MREKFFTKQRTYAILILIMMIFNMFSPYGVLVNTVQASSGGTLAGGEPYLKLRLPSADIDGSVDYDSWSDATYDYYYEFDPDVDTLETYSGIRVVRMELTMNGTNTASGADIYLKYDTSKLIPAQEKNIGTNRNPIISVEEATTFENVASKAITSFGESNWGTHAVANLDVSAGTIRLAGGIAAGASYLADGEVVCTFMFMLADGVELEDLSSEDFSLLPASGLDEGLEITYWPDGPAPEGTQHTVDGSTYLVFDGFKTGVQKQPTAITLEGTMTKDRYYTGETIDYSGLSLKIEYDDNTTETITDIAQAITDGKITVDSNVASSAKKVVVTLDTLTCDIPYHVATGIQLATDPSNTTYDHGDTISFAGGVIDVIYDDGNKESLNIVEGITQGKLTVDITKADVNDTVVTLTYVDGTSTVDINLTVNDPVDSIVITTMPTDLEYDHGETIDVTGGEVKAIKRSGAEVTEIQMSDTNVTIAPTTADINSCTSTWPNGNLTAGNQPITVTYEGKTAQYTVVVNDTIRSIAVKSQPTAKNKYGTVAGSLDFTGAEITVTTASGNTFDTAVTASMVDTTGYNQSTLNVQNLPITYAGQTTTTGNGIDITLKDYITGIIVTAPSNLSVNYNEELDLTGVTYVKNYASGATSTSANVTDSMISGFNKTPAGSDFNASHECAETITVTLSTPDDADIDQIPATDTFTVTVKDVVTGIAISQTPNKIVYNYGDTFSTTGGRVQLSFASGALSSTVSMSDSRIAITETNGSAINMSPARSEFSGGLATKTLKVTYTDNGVTYDTTMNITIKDILDSIQIDTQPTTTFVHGDTFSVGNGTLKLIYKSGMEDMLALDDGTEITETSTGAEVNMSPAVSEYSSNQVIKNITVSYTEGSVTETVDYNITIKNPIDSIAIDASPTTTYNYNDPTTNVGGTLTVTRKAGNTETVNILDSMVSGLDTTVVGTGKIATVTYTEDGVTETTTYTYDVNDQVTSIVVTAPTKTTYNHGESLDLAGGKITVNTASGQSKLITMTESMITESGSSVNMSPDAAAFGTATTLNKTLTITYSEGRKTGTVSYPITIVNDVRSITMHQTPKTEYNVNDALDLNGGEILVERAVGTKEAISLSDNRVEVTGFNSSVEATNVPLTVTFEENGNSQTTSYNINVKDTVKSIKLVSTPKTQYKYDEELDLSTLEIEVEKGSGKVAIPVTQDMISGYDKTDLGDQIVTITYGGETETFTVNVKDYVIGITVNPNTVTGEYNDTLAKLINDNNITYTVKYAKDGPKTPTDLTEDMVTGYSNTSIVAQSLTVTYTDNDTNSYSKGEDFTATLDVTLSDSITGIAITKNPNKVDYGYGETLDTTGGVITVTRTSGQTQEISFTESGVTLIETDGTALDLTNVTFDANHKATKTIQVNYQGKKATFTIDITNKITGIVMENTPKTNYKVNETLDLTTDGITVGTILVTRQNGETESIKLDDINVQVTGFDSTVENTNLLLTVSYTENSVTQTTNYTVSVIDQVLNVQIENTPKTNYKYGESLDVSTGTLKITKDSGDEIIPITSNMVTELDGTPFDSTNLGTRNLKVTYGGVDMNYKITVSDYVKGIILTPPTKLTYEHGESLDLTGGSIQKIMASGANETPVALTDSSVSISGYNPTQEGAQTITVKYENYTETFGVVVEDNMQSVEITSLPTKTQYKYGDSLDVTGGKITATRSSGKTEIINITPSMVTGFNPNQLNTQTLTVTYKGKTDTYDVTVKDYITDISIVEPTKLVYKKGESIDLTGGQVKLTMASGQATSPVAMTNADVTITGFDTTSVGAKTITVNYKGFTKTFGITVVDPLSDVILKTLPNKTDYLYNESLDLTGATLEVTKESGDKEIINVTKDMVTGYNPKKLGPQTLTVTYEGFTGQFIVNVEDYVSSLKVTKPNKVDYEYGESLDLTGGKVSIVMASGKIGETAEMTASMISGFNSKQEGTQTIKVNYKGLQVNFQVKVVDKIKGISINTEPDKVEYKYGENLDVTGATITVIKSSGITTIPVTNDMVSGYDATTPSTQIITVTYGGFTTKFVVNVDEQVVIVEPEEKPEEKPEEPKQEETKEEKPDRVTNRPVKLEVEEVIEETPVEVPEVIEETPVEVPEETPVEPPTTEVEEEKSTETLGVKEEKDDIDKDMIVIDGIGLAGILFIFLIIFRRHNVKVYVEEEEKFVLGGLDRIKKKNPKLDIDQYLDGETYPNRVKVHLKKSISKKLDGKEIEIKHRRNIIKHKVEYNDKPYEFILE